MVSLEEFAIVSLIHYVNYCMCLVRVVCSILQCRWRRVCYCFVNSLRTLLYVSCAGSLFCLIELLEESLLLFR